MLGNRYPNIDFEETSQTVGFGSFLHISSVRVLIWHDVP